MGRESRARWHERSHERAADTFRASADAYDRHIGRYGPELARALCDAAGVAAGQRALDVGCGPGALGVRARAAARHRRGRGGRSVAVVRGGMPGAAPGPARREAVGERLPFEDASFDRALAQLVVNFMTDPPAGVGEMVRVTRPGGVVGAAVWDYAGAMTLLRRGLGRGDRAGPRGRGARRGRSMPFCTPEDLAGLLVGRRAGRRRRRRGRGRARTTTGSTTSGARSRRASGPPAPTCWASTSTAARRSPTVCSARLQRRVAAVPPHARGRGWRRASGREAPGRIGHHGRMAYDEDLANRIRELIADEPDVTEQRMFGGLAFLIGGHMSVAVSGRGGLLVRCDPDETEALLAKPHTGPMVMRGREMRGWLRVEAEGVRTKRQLEPWVSARRRASPARCRPSDERGATRSPAATPFEHFEREHEAAYRDMPPVNVLVAGPTGVGKSTLRERDPAASPSRGPARAGRSPRTSRPGASRASRSPSTTRPGLELDERSGKAAKRVARFVKDQLAKPPAEHLHVFWYCVHAQGNRFQDAEADFIEAISQLLPSIVVLTQVLGPGGRGRRGVRDAWSARSSTSTGRT